MKKHVRFFMTCLILAAAFLLLPGAKSEAKAAVRLNKTVLKVAQGKTKQLKVKGTDAEPVWSVGKTKVLSVEDGKITALKGGTTMVYAKVAGTTLRCKVTVVGLNKTTLTLAKKSKFQLKAKNGKNSVWSSSDPSVAKVTKKGVVKAKKSGTATITCQTNGKKVRCKVYVPSLNQTSVKIAVGSTYQLTASNYGESAAFYSDNPYVAQVDSNGLITANTVGTAKITFQSGKAALTCEVTVISPTDITTPRSSLPTSSNVSKLSVTINSYPNSRTYTVYNQGATENDSVSFPKYMPNHGCAACAVTTVLSAYANYQSGPAYMTDVTEKSILGTAWTANYEGTDEEDAKENPLSLYGITKILDAYSISNRYVRSFEDATALTEITAHLKTGNPVIIEVKKGLWANSYHTMVLLGMTDDGYVIVADSANRRDTDERKAAFGDNQRIKYAKLYELIPEMLSSTNLTSTGVYWSGASASGGYVLVNPQQ